MLETIINHGNGNHAIIQVINLIQFGFSHCSGSSQIFGRPTLLIHLLDFPGYLTLMELVKCINPMKTQIYGNSSWYYIPASNLYKTFKTDTFAEETYLLNLEVIWCLMLQLLIIVILASNLLQSTLIQMSPFDMHFFIALQSQLKYLL